MRYRNHDTPCIGICSTIYGDEVCRGCKRASKEVIVWNTLPIESKDSILSRLDDFTAEVTASKLSITDPQRLEAMLQHHRIRYRPEFSPYTWAYNLLRAGAHMIQAIDPYGIEIKPEFAHYTLRELIHLIDDELYANSQAYLREQKP